MLPSFYFALSAHPAFIGHIDELNVIVLRLSSVHNSQEMLFSQFSSDFNFVWIVWKSVCIKTALGLVFDDCRTIVKCEDYVAVFIGACWTLPIEAW